MKSYALIFRMDLVTTENQPTNEQMNEYMKMWGRWMNSMATKNQLLEGGNHFSKEGRVVRSAEQVTEGPYVANNESVAGYILVAAASFEEAVELAMSCPILAGYGNSVEVRELAAP